MDFSLKAMQGSLNYISRTKRNCYLFFFGLYLLLEMQPVSEQVNYGNHLAEEVLEKK